MSRINPRDDVEVKTSKTFYVLLFGNPVPCRILSADAENKTVTVRTDERIEHTLKSKLTGNIIKMNKSLFVDVPIQRIQKEFNLPVTIKELL